MRGAGRSGAAAAFLARECATTGAGAAAAGAVAARCNGRERAGQTVGRRVPVHILDRHRRQAVPLPRPGTEPRHHHRVRTQVVEEVRIDRHLLDVQNPRQHLRERLSDRSGRRSRGRRDDRCRGGRQRVDQIADRRVPVHILDRHRRQAVPLPRPGTEPRHHHRVRTQVVEEVRIDRHLLDVQDPRQYLGQCRRRRDRRRNGSRRRGRDGRDGCRGRTGHGDSGGHRLHGRSRRNGHSKGGHRLHRHGRRNGHRHPRGHRLHGRSRPNGHRHPRGHRLHGHGRRGGRGSGRFGQSDRQGVGFLCHCVNSLNRFAATWRVGRRLTTPPPPLARSQTNCEASSSSSEQTTSAP